MKRDLYLEVLSRITAELQVGAAPWLKPWSVQCSDQSPL
jgi:antirestriction protein ArdC